MPQAAAKCAFWRPERLDIPPCRGKSGQVRSPIVSRPVAAVSALCDALWGRGVPHPWDIVSSNTKLGGEDLDCPPQKLRRINKEKAILLGEVSGPFTSTGGRGRKKAIIPACSARGSSAVLQHDKTRAEETSPWARVGPVCRFQGGGGEYPSRERSGRIGPRVGRRWFWAAMGRSPA